MTEPHPMLVAAAKSKDWSSMFDRAALAVGLELINITPADGVIRSFTGDDVRKLTRAAFLAIRDLTPDVAEVVVPVPEAWERPLKPAHQSLVDAYKTAAANKHRAIINHILGEG